MIDSQTLLNALKALVASNEELLTKRLIQLDDYGPLEAARSALQQAELEFTQGPWSVKPVHFGLGIFAQDTVAIAVRTDQNMEANALLIAAAPDLFEACRQALKYSSCGLPCPSDDSCGQCSVRVPMANAVKKATGR